MKKILLVSHSLSKTGAPLVLINIANHLDELGYNISLININSASNDLTSKLNKSIKIFNYPIYISKLKNNDFFILSILGRVIGKLFSISNYFRKILSIIKPQLVIFNTIYHLNLSKITEDNEIPSIRYIHESWSFLSSLNNEERFNLLTSKDRFLACSKNVKYLLESFYGLKNVNVIYPILKINSKRKRKISNKDPNDFKVCSAGSIYYIKGFDLWLKVAINTLNMDANILFEWYGSNSNDKYFNYYLSRIPNKFKNKIVYRGEVEDLTKELENKDLFFLSSREDSFPLVCLEALNSGTPLIGFKSGGIEEFEEYGFSKTFQMGDINKISKSIIECKAENQKVYDFILPEKFNKEKNLRTVTKIVENEISKNI